MSQEFNYKDKKEHWLVVTHKESIIHPMYWGKKSNAKTSKQTKHKNTSTNQPPQKKIKKNQTKPRHNKENDYSLQPSN